MIFPLELPRKQWLHVCFHLFYGQFSWRNPPRAPILWLKERTFEPAGGSCCLTRQWLQDSSFTTFSLKTPTAAERFLVDLKESWGWFIRDINIVKLTLTCEDVHIVVFFLQHFTRIEPKTWPHTAFSTQLLPVASSYFPVSGCHLFRLVFQAPALGCSIVVVENPIGDHRIELLIWNPPCQLFLSLSLSLAVSFLLKKTTCWLRLSQSRHTNNSHLRVEPQSQLTGGFGLTWREAPCPGRVRGGRLAAPYLKKWSSFVYKIIIKSKEKDVFQALEKPNQIQQSRHLYAISSDAIEVCPRRVTWSWGHKIRLWGANIHVNVHPHPLPQLATFSNETAATWWTLMSKRI